MKNALRIAVNWLWNKITHIDYAMIAAAFVEVPRWAVAFAAIREPMWAAFPMGLLLAWAASAGWKAYFEDKSRHLLLIINGASLAGALIVIAPVLYAMTYMPLDEIDLSTVLPPQYLWVWAIVLSITTFVPLVQVAAVKAYQSKPAETPATANDTTVPPSVESGASCGHSEGVSVGVVQQTQPVESPKAAKTVRKPAPTLRKVGKTNEWGLTDKALGDLLGVSRQRVGTMRNDGTLTTRVARELPQLEPIHTNGTGAH